MYKKWWFWVLIVLALVAILFVNYLFTDNQCIYEDDSSSTVCL